MMNVNDFLVYSHTKLMQHKLVFIFRFYIQIYSLQL